MTCPDATCQFQRKGVSRARKPRLTDAIERLLHPRSQEIVRELVLESLNNVHVGVLDGATDSAAVRLQDLALRMSSVNLLSLFFALLNVDDSLKKSLFEMESGPRYKKLVRFLIDLRKTVVAFFADTRVSNTKFVQQCEELYVLS